MTLTAVNHRILSSGRSSPMALSSQHSGLGAQWFLGAWEVGDVGGSFGACYFMVLLLLVFNVCSFPFDVPFFSLFFLLLTYLLVNSCLRVLSSFVLIGGEGRLLQLWSCFVFKLCLVSRHATTCCFFVFLFLLLALLVCQFGTVGKFRLWSCVLDRSCLPILRLCIHVWKVEQQSIQQ